MLREIGQEITKLTKDQKFVRNLSLLAILTFATSCSIEINTRGQLAQRGQLNQCSSLMSTGLCIKTHNIHTR